jgi:hypothetical protein
LRSSTTSHLHDHVHDDDYAYDDVEEVTNDEWVFRVRGKRLPPPEDQPTHTRPLTSKNGARERAAFAGLARVLDCVAQGPVGPPAARIPGPDAFFLRGCCALDRLGRCTVSALISRRLR